MADRARLLRRRRVGAVAERDRHQRQRDHDRHDGEDGEAAGAEHRDQELRAGDRADVDDAVKRQHACPVGVGDPGVQPAFHDGEEAGEAEAGGKADRRPHDRVDDQHQEQRAGRSGGGERGEGAHVADGRIIGVIDRQPSRKPRNRRSP